MKLLSAALLALALAVAVRAFEEEESVIVATDANFDDVIAAHKFLLVEFYAPWCGHCKSLKKPYEEAAKKLLAAGGDDVPRLVKVDATENSAVAERFEIAGFPTLKWFVNGKDTEYNGGRTAEDIVKWVTKKSGPPAAPINNKETLEKLKTDNSVITVGVFASEDSAEAKAFLAAAATSDAAFGITTDSDVAAELEVTAPAVVLFKQFDEGRVDMTDDITEDNVAAFVKGNQLPLVIEFTDESAAQIFGGDIKNHLLLFMDSDTQDQETLLAAMKEVATDERGQILFIYIMADKGQNARILEFFGLGAKDLPAVRLISLEQDMAKFAPADKDITADVLRAFTADFKAGNLKPHRKSETTPDDWDAKPVKVLTGENFDEVARDPSKHVFVEFYAPWCGHCKSLMPIWEQLAEQVEGHDNIVIAKLDATANEVEGVTVESFPTLKLFTATADNEIIDFDGSRDIKGFAAFLKEHTGVEVNAEGHDEL